MGFGLFNSPKPYKGQEYAKLRKQAQSSGHLFIDDEFRPEDKSLFYNPSKMAGIVWKRPKDICSDPHLFVEGIEGNDVHQGRLGNCWFVAACTCLTLYKEVWQNVIPDHKDQEWDPEKPERYAGIFHFRFWRHGEWIDVVIDDFLPTLNDQLVFVHSQSRNEFWSALLEKAYAKLFGCYEALDGGELAEALVDFTAGVAEPIDMTAEKYSTDAEKRHELFKMLDKEMDVKSLMAAAIPATSADEMEASTDVGLVKGHAYAITAIKKVPLDGTGLFGIFNKEKIEMARLRNPWGKGEWKGAFSDDIGGGVPSPEWQKISKSDREKIGLTFEDDGEFWMSFEDYCKHFTNMSICRVINTNFFSVRKTWKERMYVSAWKKPQLAGGCINNKDTFLNNPQFLFDVSDDKETVLVSLSQKGGRGTGQGEKLVIGFCIMRVDLNRDYRVHKLPETVKTSNFKNSRSIFLRTEITKGRYMVIPCTFEPGHESEFVLRIYTTGTDKGKELIRDTPPKDMCFCLRKYPTLVTRIRLIKASGLEKQDKVGVLRKSCGDPYCIIECEGEKVTTKVCHDTLNPEWNQSAIFYRRDPENKPVTVTVWNKNPIVDEFMGCHVFTDLTDKEGRMLEAELHGKAKDKVELKPGKLYVEISHKQDLTSL